MRTKNKKEKRDSQVYTRLEIREKMAVSEKKACMVSKRIEENDEGQEKKEKTLTDPRQVYHISPFPPDTYQTG